MNGSTFIQRESDNYLFVVTISLIAAISGLLFGYDTGVISGALQFISGEFQIKSTSLKEFIVSAVPIGALIGAILSSLSSAWLGRRLTILATSVLFILGALITATAISPTFVIIGRLLMGFAVGLSAMVVPMYLSEVSPAAIRGTVVFLFQLTITLGLLAAFIVNYLYAGTGDWRTMFTLALIPSFILGIGMLFMPRSPRWLFLKGRFEEAKAVLHKLHAAQNVSKEIEEIRVSLNHPKCRLSDIFTTRLFGLVIISFGLFVFQQLSGINAVLYYAPTVFSHAGFKSGSHAILPTIIVGSINVIATMIGVWVVDFIGRKKLLYIGCSGIIISMLLLGAAYHHWFGPDPATLILLLVLLFICSFAIGLGGVPYVMMSELFPLHARSHGMAIASVANWGFNFLVTATFLSYIQLVGIGNAFWTFAFFTVLCLLFVIALVPETKGLTLDEIEGNLYKKLPLRRLGDKKIVTELTSD